ncbi:MAG: hypothetical protein QOD71_1353 [Thermoleophilaceae bacterium]|jgi:RNA polymerase sigma factor (sigma-70 family)|nr:hypothetical protein [Thermoleophilaceae bacterium]
MPEGMSPGALSYIARHARGPLMRSQPDHRLAALVRSGSEPAFEALVARYREPLLRYCRGILPPDRAEDAVQQTFVNAHAAIAAGRSGDQLRPWLYRIAHNLAIDELRKRRGSHEALSEEMPGGDPPEEIFSRRERLAVVLAALEELPPRQRDALLLRELEGRSYDEIASALGVGDGAVRQLLNRARNTMRAAAAALVPPVVLRWSPSQTGRAAEVAGATGATTVAAKSWVGGLIAAASIGGVAAVPIVTHDVPRADRAAPAEAHQPATPPTPRVESAPAPAVVQASARREEPSEPAAATGPADANRHLSGTPAPQPRDPAAQRRTGGDDAAEHENNGSEEDDGDDAAPDPPDEEAGHGIDEAETGDDDQPEIESETEELPEEAPADDE